MSQNSSEERKMALQKALDEWFKQLNDMPSLKSLEEQQLPRKTEYISRLPFCP